MEFIPGFPYEGQNMGLFLFSPYPTLLSISYIGCEQAKCLQFFRRMVGTEMGWNFGVE